MSSSAVGSMLDSIVGAIGDAYSAIIGALDWFVEKFFGPPLHAFFDPINRFMGSFYMPWARIFALGFFILTMIWVFVGLKKEYVNLQAPSSKPWHDLRVWTVLSMLPHLVVYFYF
jgi:hypothetical protein